MYSSGQRIILLADLDCFFVEVERLHRPELRGRAVVIGGRPGERGVVAACSYEARALGIKSAMPMGEAYRRAGIWPGREGFRSQDAGFRGSGDRRVAEQISGGGGTPPDKGPVLQAAVPAAISDKGVQAGPPAPPADAAASDARETRALPPDFGHRTSDTDVVFLHEGLFGNYERYSRRVQDILRNAVPSFHARSIDEFEMDVSGCERLFAQRYGGILPFAEHLRARVRGEVGLPLSIGIGPSRIVAKMASRHAKPNSRGETCLAQQGLGTRDEGLGKKGGFRSQDSGFRGSGDRRVAEQPSGGGGTPPDNNGRRDAAPTNTSDFGRTAGSGVFRVLPEEVEAFLAPHDVQAVPGIGPATSAKLRELGINRVGQLLAQPPNLLRQAFGIGMLGLVEALRSGYEAGEGTRDEGLGTREEAGLDAVPVYPVGPRQGGASLPDTGRMPAPPDARETRALPPHPAPRTSDFGLRTSDSPPGIYSAAPSRRPKSIGHETTFSRDVIDPAVWERTLWRLTEDACRRLRSADLRARQITLKIRYSDFGTLTHGGPLSEPTDLDSVIFQRVKELFAEGNTRRLRIRLLGVRLEKLCVGASQGLLFESRRMQREHDFFAAVDCIRDKHGDDAVLVGPGVAKLKEVRPLAGLSTAGIQTGFMHGRN